MTRRLLALLALLTGLAALGSPAQASLAEALACDASIAAAAGDEGIRSEAKPAQSVPATIRATRKVETPESRPVRPRAVRLPVLMGIERAYE